MDNNLENKIEAILFFKNEPVSYIKLADFLSVSIDEIKEAVNNLKNSLKKRGIILIEKSSKNEGDADFSKNQIMLAVNNEYAKLIETLQKEELNKELSKASLETLSIILYKNGATRHEIDYIRGVNSSFTLRALSIRGLIEKEISKLDNRRYIYKPTFDLLSYMGISKIEDLPSYNEINNNFENIKNNENEKEEI